MPRFTEQVAHHDADGTRHTVRIVSQVFQRLQADTFQIRLHAVEEIRQHVSRHPRLTKGTEYVVEPIDTGRMSSERLEYDMAPGTCSRPTFFQRLTVRFIDHVVRNPAQRIQMTDHLTVTARKEDRGKRE